MATAVNSTGIIQCNICIYRVHCPIKGCKNVLDLKYSSNNNNDTFFLNIKINDSKNDLFSYKALLETKNRFIFMS